MNLSTFTNTFHSALLKTWPMLTLFFVIIAIVRITKVLVSHEKIALYKEFYGLLAIIYFLILYYLLLSTENASSGINMVPFREITRYEIGSTLFIYNVIGNIVLFIPFGYIISDYLNVKKVPLTVLISIIISLTAEVIQFKIGRAFDIDDVILNVVGATIGYLIYVAIQSIKNHLPKILKNNLFYNILALLVLIALIVLFGNIWGIRLS